jgi:Protein of unknown function (DUF2793)
MNMTELTDRLTLPLLAAGQAQKEIWHNEALIQLDFLVQGVVVAVAPVSVPATPSLGQSWIVGASPSGAWVGHANALACWTTGGWRFAGPIEGMTVWSLADSLLVRRTASAWVKGDMTAASVKIGGNQVLGARQSAIASPSGGSVIDTEARLALTALLAAARTHGLIAP